MLREGADQGIPQAACRLGAELIRCARVRDTLVMLGEAQAAAARAPKNAPEAARMSQYAVELSRALAEDNRMCSGVAVETAREAWRYLYSAAAAGNVAAMSRFVRDPGLELNDPDATEGWSAYRQDAPAFLQGAIKGGDVRALYQAWFSAFSGQSSGGSDIFVRDPDKALQYGTAAVICWMPIAPEKCEPPTRESPRRSDPSVPRLPARKAKNCATRISIAHACRTGEPTMGRRKSPTAGSEHQASQRLIRDNQRSQ